MNKKFIFFKFLLLLIFTTLACLPAQAKTPQIIVSIKPLHGLVSAITKGVTTPYLLIDGLNSPHHFTLKPSEVAKISKSDLIIWVGPYFEPPIAKLISSQSSRLKSLSIISIPGLNLLPASEDHTHEHERAHQEHEHEEHSHENSKDKTYMTKKEEMQIDGHLWLDIDNAIMISKAISAQLSKQDPDNHAIYQSNTNLLITKLQKLKASLKKQLTPIQTKPFMVFHNAYQYFIKQHNLAYQGALTINPSIPLSAKQVKKTQTTLIQKNIICLFKEPQFNPSILSTLTKGTKIEIATLDPLGGTLTSDTNSYIALMENLADNLSSCLAN